MNVELISNESGDWEVLKVNGKDFYSGHSIPNDIWMELLESEFGATTTSIEVTDDEMEEMGY